MTFSSLWHPDPCHAHMNNPPDVTTPPGRMPQNGSHPSAEEGDSCGENAEQCLILCRISPGSSLVAFS